MPSYHNRSKTISAGAVASTGLLLAQGVQASSPAIFNKTDNVAVYWGQNSYNQGSGELAQQSLADYCANSNIDIIPMSFLIQLTTGQGGEPVVNFANAGDNCTLFPDSALLDCPQIGEDITTCQDKYNKTILLSIGGATYTEGGFASEDAAVKAANLVWETFGPADSSVVSNGTTTNSTATPATNMTMSAASSSSKVTSTSTNAGGLNRTAPAAAPSPTLDYDPQDPLWAVSLLAKITATTESSTLKSGSKTDGSVLRSTTDPSTLKTKTKTKTKSLKESTAERTANPTASLSANHKDSSSTSSSDQSTAHKTQKSQKQKARSTVYQTHTDYATNDRVATIVDATGTRFIPPGKVSSTSVAEAAKSSATSSSHHSEAEKKEKTISATPKVRTVNYDGTHNARRQATPSKVLRPFHDATVDGFDLDIEAPGQNFPAFANQLRKLMDAEKKAAKTDKDYYLTAAPQCPYPDVNNNDMLNGGVSFDAVFVQFYNNYCGVQSFTPGTSTTNSTNTTTSSAAPTQNNYNFETWHNWATTNSSNPDVKIFVGVPAGQSAAGSGYVAPEGLKPVIEYSKGFSSFGGVMAWDASQAIANKGFLEGVKSALKAAPAAAPASKGKVAKTQKKEKTAKKEGRGKERNVRRVERQPWWA